MKKKTINRLDKKNSKEQTIYQNRELSWLKFNERVLQEAADPSVPLCERLSFVSIFQSNLEEFFMVRVGSLFDQMLYAGNRRENKTGMTAQQQLKCIYKRAGILMKHRDLVYHKLMAKIKENGLELVKPEMLGEEEQRYLEGYFREAIQPLLSPQVVGKKQPFPFLRNKESYAVALLQTKNKYKIAVIPCSYDIFPRMISIPATEKTCFILVEDVILYFMSRIFKNYTIVSKSLIRVIRSADIDVDVEDADVETGETRFSHSGDYTDQPDYRNMMQNMIRQRKRLRPVMLECTSPLEERTKSQLCHQLKLEKAQIFTAQMPLDPGYIDRIRDEMRNQKELFYEKCIPQPSRQLTQDRSIMEQIQKKDILLSYPYESMQPLIQFLTEAGTNPKVLSIKITLYRVAQNSQVIEALIRAAEYGKEVLVVVELKARFDEENNIHWSRRLEEAGCRVLYGIDYIKVHSKLCLVTYRDGNVIRHLTQIGTGNYNEHTARMYADLCLMTAHEGIARDAIEVFTKLCLGEYVQNSRHLLVSPKCMEHTLFFLMDAEIAKAREGKPAYIGIKVNALTDKVLIDKLVECAQNGVKVELIVRGICCLIPQIPGKTEHITVISIVGRYLEHSRIYIFGTPDHGQEQIYLSSADFMTRNMMRRVEVAVPVYDPDHRARIRELFQTMMQDQVKARELKEDGKYYKRTFTNVTTPLNAQETFLRKAYLSIHD